MSTTQTTEKAEAHTAEDRAQQLLAGLQGMLYLLDNNLIGITVDGGYGNATTDKFIGAARAAVQLAEKGAQ